MSRDTLIEWGGSYYRPDDSALGVEPLAPIGSVLMSRAELECKEQAEWLQWQQATVEAAHEVTREHPWVDSANHGFLVARRLLTLGISFTAYDYSQFDPPTTNLSETLRAHDAAVSQLELIF